MLRNKQKSTLRCGNQIIEVTQPVVMGILNATPDSFYSASRTGNSIEKAVVLAHQMIAEGASILDIGGMSTRPGANEISAQEEIERVLPVIAAISSTFPDTVLSVDTYRSVVAEEAIKAGATMINDISGGLLDPDMLNVVSRHQVAYVAMHMRGTPANMQQYTDYQNVIGEVLKYFVIRLRALSQAGIHEVIVDPGFGFAKDLHQNYQLIDQLGVFRLLERPLLVGVSRKSTLSKTIGRPTEETLAATTSLHMVALQNGASILRVHDVLAAMDAIAVFQQLNSSGFQQTLKN
jgi:dihydropteroate synthase